MKFGGTVIMRILTTDGIREIKIPKMRGSKVHQIMRDHTKYNRKIKHRRNEW
jgi:hypothetical protein